MNDESFYMALPSLNRFQELAVPANYVPVPSSWYVLITDVVGSTRAIEAGRYKDINLLGASSIIAVLNTTQGVEIPFIFGGDGASLLVPPRLLHSARDTLLRLRYMARVAFGMNLRVGIVPVEIVLKQSQLMVAKVKVTKAYNQASFIGGGLTYATHLVKTDPTYRLEQLTTTHAPDLSGLECRWQDIPSPYGHTLSLIVAPPANASLTDPLHYQQILEQIQRIYGDDEQYRPVTASSLRLSFNTRQLAAEIKARTPSPRPSHRSLYLLKILLENILGAGFMGLGLRQGDTHWGEYKADLCAAVDFQKLEDSLRMVISGTPAQTQQLRTYLEARFQAGELVYGMHISNRALMTCLIMDRNAFHIHLVDAADGGYAIAAKALKARLRTLARTV